MNRWRHGAALAIALLTAACGGVRHHVDAKRPRPHTVAVLPFAGDADPALRDAARALVHGRLADRGLLAADLAWVDQRLAEGGWLADPQRFDPRQLPLDRVVAALGVDAVLVGWELGTSSFNLLVLRRQAVSGSLAIRGADGTAWWSADHGASELGGFLWRSGQLLAELQAQGQHGTPMATLALLDTMLQEAVDTVPAATLPPMAGAPPQLRRANLTQLPAPGGQQRLLVEASADPRAQLVFDVLPHRTGVPMAARPDAPGRFTGAQDLPSGTAFQVVVRARDPYGRETALEVKQ